MTALAIETSGTSFLDDLEDIPEIRPFPATASRLMAACQNSETNCNDVSEIIECDPGLALRILRMTNSAMFGLRNEVRTIEHAVVVLGMRAVRDLAMSLAAANLFANGNPTAEIERQSLWHHSLSCATVARLLAKRVKVSPDEAYLAGIFHDAGKLVFLDTIPERYAAATSGRSIKDIISVEEAEFGISHQDLGLECGDNWGLSFEISEAIGFHHRPGEAQDALPLVELTSVANCLSRAWGVDGNPSPVDSDGDTYTVAGVVIQDEWLDEVREQAVEAFQESLEICSG